ncbi:hypothetical protein [Brevundimonas sp. NPDC058933]|uniref:hypothetical protein n=1 Tax=Brevundimonas sp. NPDC058933 TaxID=3346673 RepID=UPI003BEF448C
MLDNGLVFVLGAGFSAELGLPLGWRLKQAIADIIPSRKGGGNEHVSWAFLQDRDVEVAMNASEQLRRALPLAASIDNLVEHLSSNKDVVSCAKIGIAATILQSERQSTIFGPAGSGLSVASHNTAFADLFRLIVGSVPLNRMDYAFSRLKVINFNYDRCLEQFMTRAVMDYSGTDLRRAQEIVSQATILHPYGSLGPLTSKADFGQKLDWIDIKAVSENIRTFSEEIGSKEHTDIKSLASSASRLVFMGCAYHRQNLDLIRPDTNTLSRVDGTMYSPLPVDPDGHATMSMSAFNEPAISELVSKISDWPRGASLVRMNTRQFRIEALSNRQLIARHGTEWVQ